MTSAATDVPGPVAPAAAAAGAAVVDPSAVRLAPPVPPPTSLVGRGGRADEVDTDPQPAVPRPRGRVLLPVLTAAAFLIAWDAAVRLARSDLFPKPWDVLLAIKELAVRGVLFNYVVSSLFRVTIGFTAAVLVGVPFGLLLGWFGPLARMFNPLIQVLRPISPIAWIPVAILWFGVDDRAPTFLIFLASVFPITVAAMAAVQNIPSVYVRAARNFGLSRLDLFRKVIFPATLPQIITAVRISLGVAWLVVVAAEMLAVDPRSGGLGYLIIDARNAGKRYDLVVAGMVLIGVIGLLLDVIVRRLERFDEVRWGYTNR